MSYYNKITGKPEEVKIKYKDNLVNKIIGFIRYTILYFILHLYGFRKLKYQKGLHKIISSTREVHPICIIMSLYKTKDYDKELSKYYPNSFCITTNKAVFYKKNSLYSYPNFINYDTEEDYLNDLIKEKKKNTGIKLSEQTEFNAIRYSIKEIVKLLHVRLTFPKNDLSNFK